MPHTGPGLQFNFPSVASLKYYPRNEIRAPEYRVWSRCRETDGDMAWFLRARGGPRWVGGAGGGGLDLLPKWHRKYLPPRHLAIETYALHPPFSLLPSSRHSSVLRRGSQSRRGRPGRAPKPATEKGFPSRCQRSRKFNSLERLCFAFLKPLRAPRGRRARHRCERKNWKLSNDLGAFQWFFFFFGGGGPSELFWVVSVDVPESVLHIHYRLFPGLTWQDFNCLHFWVKSRMSRVRAPCLLGEGCGKSNTSAQHNLINT